MIIPTAWLLIGLMSNGVFVDTHLRFQTKKECVAKKKKVHFYSNIDILHREPQLECVRLNGN